MQSQNSNGLILGLFLIAFISGLFAWICTKIMSAFRRRGNGCLTNRYKEQMIDNIKNNPERKICLHVDMKNMRATGSWLQRDR
jgi:hypothetical protein